MTSASCDLPLAVGPTTATTERSPGAAVGRMVMVREYRSGAGWESGEHELEVLPPGPKHQGDQQQERAENLLARRVHAFPVLSRILWLHIVVVAEAQQDFSARVLRRQ